MNTPIHYTVYRDMLIRRREENYANIHKPDRKPCQEVTQIDRSLEKQIDVCTHIEIFRYIDR